MVSSGWQPKGKVNIMPYEKIEIEEVGDLTSLGRIIFLQSDIHKAMDERNIHPTCYFVVYIFKTHLGNAIWKGKKGFEPILSIPALSLYPNKAKVNSEPCCGLLNNQRISGADPGGEGWIGWQATPSFYPHPPPFFFFEVCWICFGWCIN